MPPEVNDCTATMKRPMEKHQFPRMSTKETLLNSVPENRAGTPGCATFGTAEFVSGRRNQNSAEIFLSRNLRPAALADLVTRAFLGTHARVVLRDESGLRFWVDPASPAGRSLIHRGQFERSTVSVMQRYLDSGQTFVDIGANEGILSVIAGDIVGPEGKVLAIEPQSRLLEAICLNAGLNGMELRVAHGALGGVPGHTAQLSLFPERRSGASSIVRNYRFSYQREQVPYVDPECLFDMEGIETADLVKIDVEGFEPEVIASLTPLLSKQRIRLLYVDIHEAILKSRGMDTQSVTGELERQGYRLTEGSATGGYGLWEMRA